MFLTGKMLTPVTEAEMLEQTLPQYVQDQHKKMHPAERKFGVSVLRSKHAQKCSTQDISVALTNCIRRGTLRLRIDRGSRARFLPGRS